jgi:hypothetical protein
MGIFSLQGNVITKYSADVSDQVAGLRELQAEEKELAEKRAAGVKESNEGIASNIAALGGLALALGAVRAAWEGYKEGVTEARLEHTAAGVDLDRLSTAAGGLKDHLDLLTFAAKAHASAWKNTQGDLETAERAMRLLSARLGGDPDSVDKATDAVTNAVVGLKTKGLKALGLDIDDSKVKFDEFGNALGSTKEKLEQHTKIMEALRALTRGVADDQDNVGDAFQRSQVKMTDSWRDVKLGLGQLVEAMQPLLAAFAGALTIIAKIAQYIPNLSMARNATQGVKDAISSAFSVLHGGKAVDSFIPDAGAMSFQSDPAGGLEGERSFQERAANDRVIADTTARIAAVAKILGNRYAQPTEINEGLEFKGPGKDTHGDELRKKAAEFASKVAKEVTDEFVKTLDAEMASDASAASKVATSALLRRTAGLSGGGTEGSGRWVNGADGMPRWEGGNADGLGAGATGLDNRNLRERADVGSALDNFYAPGGEQSKRNDASYNQFMGKQNTTAVEKMFGKVDEIHATKEAFSALTESVGAGYKAMVEGHGSVGDAIKKTLANTLEAEGAKMAVLAIENTAYGFAALALGPIGGASAASYFTAAAGFGAGAIAAGIAARALGAGGMSVATPSSSSAGASTPSSVPAGSSATGNTTNTTVVYGDNFSGQSTRQRAVNARKMIALTQGPGTGKDQVVYA